MPSTVRLLSRGRGRTTRCKYLGTVVTQEMHFQDTTEWCSPLMTETTTWAVQLTVLWAMAVDSGTRAAPLPVWTLSADMAMTGIGTRAEGVFCCKRPACGWRAKSLRQLCWTISRHNSSRIVNLSPFSVLANNIITLLLIQTDTGVLEAINADGYRRDSKYAQDYILCSLFALGVHYNVWLGTKTKHYWFYWLRTIDFMIL